MLLPNLGNGMSRESDLSRLEDVSDCFGLAWVFVVGEADAKLSRQTSYLHTRVMKRTKWVNIMNLELVSQLCGEAFH